MTALHATSSGEKRIFVSIPLERHFTHIFLRYRDTHSNRPYLRWTPERKLHLTLLFLGAVPETDITTLIDMLAAVTRRHAPFSLELDKVSYAPPERPADMVWAYLLPTDALYELVRDIYDTVYDLGITPADSYRNGRDILIPHVTLARFKGRPFGHLTDLRRTGLEGQALVVDAVHLMESRTTKEGTIYVPLATYTLGQ